MNAKFVKHHTATARSLAIRRTKIPARLLAVQKMDLIRSVVESTVGAARAVVNSAVVSDLRYEFYLRPSIQQHHQHNNMVVPSGSYQAVGQPQQISCFQKMKFGFLMGACIGAATGLLIGGFSVFRSNLARRERLQTIGKMIIGSGGSFGTFMAVGQGIRC